MSEDLAQDIKIDLKRTDIVTFLIFLYQGIVTLFISALTVKPGVDVMIIIFCDYGQFFGDKIGI
jgi:succinate-acetate transporter protein